MGATVAEDLKERILADTTLAALATGGVYAPIVDGRGPIQPGLTSPAYETDTGSGVRVLKPCIVVSRSSVAPAGPVGIAAEPVYRIGCYQDDGYDVTGAMLRALHALLHNQWWTLDDGCTYRTWYMDGMSELQDDKIVGGSGKPGVSYEFARFLVTIRWAGA